MPSVAGGRQARRKVYVSYSINSANAKFCFCFCLWLLHLAGGGHDNDTTTTAAVDEVMHEGRGWRMKVLIVRCQADYVVGRSCLSCSYRKLLRLRRM